MTDMKKLKETLAARRMRAAKKADGTVFLTAQVIAGLEYMAPENFVQDLEARGETIDEVTLEITKTVVKKATPVKAAPKPEGDQSAVLPDGTYTKAVLTAMTWTEIRAAAKADDQVDGRKNKVSLIKDLTGRPIL